MKNILIIIGSGAVIAVAVGFFIFRTAEYDSKSTAKINTPANPSSQSIASQATKKYNDPAGFRFDYPESVSISPLETTDNNVYSFLGATSSSILGNITIKAASSELLTLDNILKSKTGVTDIKFADLKAKQYAEKGTIVTLALDDGVLFTITVSSGGHVDYWNEVNNKIISSFVFALPETTQEQSDSTSPSTDSDISFEGEETIE